MPDMTNPQGIVVQKPRWDVYTTMLVIAFVAVLTAIILLALEMKEYNFETKANVQISSLDRPAAVERMAESEIVLATLA